MWDEPVEVQPVHTLRYQDRYDKWLRKAHRDSEALMKHAKAHIQRQMWEEYQAYLDDLLPSERSLRVMGDITFREHDLDERTGVTEAHCTIYRMNYLPKGSRSTFPVIP